MFALQFDCVKSEFLSSSTTFPGYIITRPEYVCKLLIRPEYVGKLLITILGEGIVLPFCPISVVARGGTTMRNNLPNYHHSRVLVVDPKTRLIERLKDIH